MIGRIYKIIHTQSNLVYVGSTFNELKYRFQQHKGSFKQWLNDNHSEITIFPYFKEHGIDQFRMVLIKEYDVDDRAHLRAYEQLWINKLKSINKNNPFHLKSLYFKAYERNNKEYLDEYRKEYRKNHKDEVKQYNKKYREANKDALYERFNCECGGTYSKKHRARHLKSKMHTLFISN